MQLHRIALLMLCGPAIGACSSPADAGPETPSDVLPYAGPATPSGGAAGTSGGLAGVAGTTSTAGTPGTAGAGGTAGGAGSGAVADGGDTDAGTGPGPAMPAYEDPGTGPWMPVADVALDCKLDPTLLAAADGEIATDYAVVRYGKLCHESGTDSPAEVWSATKTLGALVTGIASYETRDIPRTGPRTGQLSDLDRADHWLTSVSYNQDAQVAHVLAMIGHNSSLAYGSRTYSYDTVGSVQINSLSDMVNAAIAQDSARLGANIEAFTQTFLYDAIGMTDSTWSNGSSDKTYAYTWSTTLRDMARVGLLVMHRGWWAGKRVLDESWTYKMTHPSFEDANTGYGYLTWLNAAEGATGPGGSFGGVAGDPCAPYALWPSYPHGTLSQAPDCLYTQTPCTQEQDAGIWSAQGLGGQFIVAHPGLDLVIVAKNFSGQGGPTGLWSAIRPALVALDPVYAGDEASFCTDYNAGRYAPDLMGAPTVPQD